MQPLVCEGCRNQHYSASAGVLAARAEPCPECGGRLALVDDERAADEQTPETQPGR